MAGHHGDARQRGDELLEQRHRLVVEVVGRLVEQHARRPPGDQGGQGEPAALAAGERGRRARPVQPAEPEPGGGLVGPGVGVPGVVQAGPGERRVVLLGRGRVVEPGRELLEPGHRTVQGCERLVEDVADGGAVGEVGLLGQVHEVGGALDRARVRRLGPGEQTEQRGLADAVLTDQAERPAGGGDEVDAVEHEPVAVGLGQVAADERGQDGEGGDRGHEGTPITGEARAGDRCQLFMVRPVCRAARRCATEFRANGPTVGEL